MIPATKIAAVVGARDAAVAAATEAAATLARGFALSDEAARLAHLAHDGHVFHDRDHATQAAFRALFGDKFDAAVSAEAFRKEVDARTWVRLLSMCGIRDLMDRTAVDHLYADLAASVPAVTEEVVEATLTGLRGDARLIFQRGIARVFVELDRRFKSHDGFKLGGRIILTRMFDEYGFWNHYARSKEKLADVERVFAVLDGGRPNPSSIAFEIEAGRAGRHGPRQGKCESTYFRINTFINGNAHLWFVDDALVARVNAELADYYGAVLPDAVDAPRTEADLRASTRAVSKDLAFYPTPVAVANVLIREAGINEDSRVLEPSAGTGNIAVAALKAGASVFAVEVDESRYAALSLLPYRRFSAVRTNFLRLQLREEYTHVLMNPPFYGTHWMDHVVHAFGALQPGGQLLAVVPASAEVNEGKKHEDFRKWATARAEYRHRLFSELPPESFAESGTRVQTVVLHLRRR